MSRRPWFGVAATVLAAALAVPLGSTPASAAPARPAKAQADPLRWVTLPTGDRVALRPGATATRPARPGNVLVRPAAGRERMRFQTYTDHGDTLVVPADAAPLIAAGRLDRRLFNLTKLIRYGYDDAHRGDLPMIVDYAPSAGLVPAAKVRIAAAGARASRDLPSLGGQAVRAGKATAQRFWAAVRGDLAQQHSSGVTAVWLDGPVRASLDQSVPQIGAPTAWQAGQTGQGVRVAVLDTGLDASHPDLADAVDAAEDFTGSGSGTDDRVGHGTHVASTITGNGAASGGKYKGVAPDAHLLIGKVLDDFGFGDESGIIAGMEWAAAQHARVVNMSFGSPFGADGTDPVEQALTRLTANGGPLFVVAAGNDGPSEETIGSPAETDAALTVGAVDKQNRLATFSSRGPARSDLAIKPEITAPGVDIVAAKAANSAIGTPVGDSYLSLSGTSMATPHVAGAAAILAGQHPDWTAEQLKSALVGSAAPQQGQTIDQQGAGRVDVARAVSQPAYAVPAVLNVGIARWPHADDPVIDRTVTYRNAGTQPVTLDLAVATTGPGGQPAPAGMFTLDQTRVTVPAGGSASVRLRTDTTGSGPDGRYTGVLTATAGGAGGTAIRTPLAVTKEVESYDVTLRFLDRHGDVTPNYGLRFVDLVQPKAYLPYDPSGTVVARVPKGRYYFEAFVQTPLSPEPFDLDLTYVFEPEVVVDRAGTMTVDARRGRPVGVTVDRPDARPGQAFTESTRATAWGFTGLISFGVNFDNQYVVPSATAATPADRYDFAVGGKLARPDGTGKPFPFGFIGSPYQYAVSWNEPGRVPANPTRHLRDRDMARSRALIAGPAGPLTDRVITLGGGVAGPSRLPASITEFHTPGTWFGDMFENLPSGDGLSAQVNSGRPYAVGRAPDERWNVPVFAPAFPPGAGQFVAQLSDGLFVDVPLYSDQVADHYGFSVEDSGSTTLYRDGVLVGRGEFGGSGFFPVPNQAAAYRLVVESTRSTAPLSTRVSGVWTFQGRPATTESGAAMPLAAVKFAPPVDAQGRAPGVPVLAVPLTVQRQDGGGFGAVATLGVRVSFDGGAHWLRVAVTGRGDHRVALVPQPRHGGYVSMRVTLADRAGNSADVTVIRAYQVR